MVIQFGCSFTTIRKDMAQSDWRFSLKAWELVTPRLAMNTNAGVLASIIAPMMFALQRRVLTSTGFMRRELNRHATMAT